jgi:anti-sigma regulatory factor (Ser/Thr protein kinase)
MPRTARRATSPTQPLRAFSPSGGPAVDLALKTTLSSSYRELPRLRDWIDHFAEYAGMSPADRFALRLAAMEIFLHVVEEAYDGEESGIVKATMLLRGAEVRLVLRDFGRRPFHLPEEHTGVPHARGSQLFLIRRLVDEVKFHTSLARGKAIEIMKRWTPSGAPAEHEAAIPGATTDVPVPPAATPVPGPARSTSSRSTPSRPRRTKVPRPTLPDA